MLRKGEELASAQMKTMIDAAQEAVAARHNDEISRLEDLGKIDDHVRQDEITAMKKQRNDLILAISEARVRLECLRLVMRMA